jgi:SPP1 family predicted phage head-tail adaptor
MGTAGQKQKRIRIEQRTLTADGHGGSAVSWSPRCVVWAHERPLNGSEAVRAQQVTATLSSVWEIWHRTDISVTDRIRSGSRICQIESAYDPKNDRAELYLLTSETQS